MSKDRVGSQDSVTVGLERTPPKPPGLRLVKNQKCPKCGSDAIELPGPRWSCINEGCEHTFELPAN